MNRDIDLGKISLTPKGDWNLSVNVEYNDIWRYKEAKYLALQDSRGVEPLDDGDYWYELSSKGNSAYQEAVNNGYIGTEEEWLETLKQPALDAANLANIAIENIDKRFPEKLDEIKNNLTQTIEEEVADKTVRPLIISTKELKIGSFRMGNDDVNIYERAVNLNSLPVTKGESKDYIIADEPLGYGLYFSVESFSATTGRGLTSNFFNFNYQITGYSINDNLQSKIGRASCRERVLRLVWSEIVGV